MRQMWLVVGLAVGLGCAGVKKEQYQAKEAEAAKYKQQAQEQAQKLADLEKQVSTLQQQNDQLHQQNATLQSSSTDLQQKLGESTATTSALQSQRPLKVNQPLLFNENSTRLTPENKRSLDSIADAVGRSKDKAIVISGFTDAQEGTTKSGQSNRWQLSSGRALEVARYLRSRGVDPTLIAVAGFGEARPVAPNDSLANRALNRRVEIFLTPKDQQMTTIELKPAELMQQGTGQGQGQGQGQNQDQGQSEDQNQGQGQGQGQTQGR